MQKKAVFGIYPSTEVAHTAVDRVKKEGFRSADIRVLFARNEDSSNFARENATVPPQGVVAAASTAEEVTGTLGIRKPAAGPTQGPLPEALLDMAIPLDDADTYVGRVKEGGILLSVKCDSPDQVARLREVLGSTGADLISTN